MQGKESVKLLEAITDIIVRTRVKEEVFLGTPSTKLDSEELKKLRASFETTVIDIYALVLESQISLVRAYTRSGFLQYGRDLFKWDKWKEAQEDLISQDESIDKMIDTLNFKTLLDIRKKLDVDMQDILQNLKHQLTNAERDKRINCLRCLSLSIDSEAWAGVKYRKRVPGKSRKDLRDLMRSQHKILSRSCRHA